MQRVEAEPTSDKSQFGDSEAASFKEGYKKASEKQVLSNPENWVLSNPEECREPAQREGKEISVRQIIQWFQEREIFAGNPEQIIMRQNELTKKKVMSIANQEKSKARQSSLYSRRKAKPSNLHLRHFASNRNPT